MAVGRWGDNMSIGWTHLRGFVVYEVLLSELGAELPFTPFEMDLLNHLNCSPAQLMANDWRSFKFLQVAAACCVSKEGETAGWLSFEYKQLEKLEG